ncbi:molecular chaperone DnaJ [Salinispirillum sp. LH 10-3-1]|uniref:Molecular chaperone DnaJ n=1 Tax=Salinispirillum sp. LH 10-3-1 TaxID=2952525 RepID=A0AB38YEA5_9GAMM
MSPAAILALASAVILGWVWVRNQPPAQRKAALIKILLFTAAAGLVFLAATGRLHVVGALLALTLPFLRRLWPLFIGLFLRHRAGRTRSSTSTPGGRSRVATAIIDMTLEHESGVMYGTILAGPLQGKELADLSDEEFIELLQYCRQQDTDSARLLETYLDKRFGDKWRADDPGTTQQGSQEQTQDNSSGPMTRAEALEILGLTADANRDDIIQAHRRLMQKMHPDRGGSAYLAARINAARTLLLD